MSKISLQKIYLPNETTCELTKLSDNWTFWLKGSFGVIRQILGKNEWELENNYIFIKKNLKAKKLNLNLIKYKPHDLVYLQQMTIAVVIGFKKYLRVRGVGFRFTITSYEFLTIQVGFSHILQATISDLFDFKQSRKFKVLRVRTLYLEKVAGLFSSLKNLSKPNVYTGKGIRYARAKEVRLLKEGKKKKF